MKIPTFHTLKMVLGTVVLCLFSAAVLAQGGNPIMVLKDPMKVPELWKKLEKNPTDSSLWVQYYGKNWQQMDLADFNKIQEWKQILMLRALAEEESIVGFRLETTSAGFFIDDFAFKDFMAMIDAAKTESDAPASGTGKSDDHFNQHFKKKKLMGIEAVIMNEHSTLNELKKNVNENFALIEDIYNELFKQFETNYVYYADAIPDGKMHETDWVTLQDKKLKELKQKQLKELYDSFSE